MTRANFRKIEMQGIYANRIERTDKQMKMCFEELECMISEVLTVTGMEEENIRIVTDVYIAQTKRGIGHHDINDIVWRVFRILSGGIKANPSYKKLSSYASMESWDGDNGTGELTCTFAMKRAVHLAGQYGMGLCMMRNSNHYLASAPYTMLAAKSGCIGMIIAKDVPSMGMPGHEGKVVGHSPNGYAFTTDEDWLVMFDGCLAYVSGHGNLNQAAEQGKAVPGWWGVGPDGAPTTDPTALLKGTRYPIGEHKGYAYAILCELLTGVLGMGPILDQTDGPDGLKNNTTHTAIALKADALMSMETFNNRSSLLIDRIRNRAPDIRIPGYRSYESEKTHTKSNVIEINDNLMALHRFLTTKRPADFTYSSLTAMIEAAGIKMPEWFL